MLSYIIFWFVIFAIVEAISLFVYFQSIGYVVSKFEITTDKDIPESVSIVMLSDLHDTDVGNNNRELLDSIDELKPDFVLLAGDMITSYMQTSYDSGVTFDFLKELASKHTVYYGLGNHEQRYLSEPEKFEGKFEALEKMTSDLGIHFLSNDKAVVEGKNITVYGLNIPIEYYRRVVTNPIPDDLPGSVFGELDKKSYNILLAHNPDQFERLTYWGADLVCSGHIHGGIVRIPGLGGVISPQLKLFPKYDGGMFEKDGVRMIVSRGIGWHTIPLRIFNKAEIVHITLGKSN